MPATNPGRILTGQSMEDLNMVSSFSLPQSVLGSILPSILTSSDLVLTYDLNDSEFYASFVEASFSLNFYLFGLIVTILLFLYGFCRATCLSLYGRNMEIAGHIFSVKTLSMVVYPTYAEYVNFCLGFMTSDLPWLNSKLPSSFFSTSDLKPMGFSFYFVNMNLAAMNLITCLIFLFLLFLSYCLLSEAPTASLRIKNKESNAKNYKFKAFKEFLMNFFGFGFAFAGFSSIVGTFLNYSEFLSLNGIFYILGVVLFGLTLSEAFSFLILNRRVGRLRVTLKATLLAAAALNPLYLSAVAIFVDAILLVAEYLQRRKALVCPKSWLAQNICILGSLLAFYFIPDSFLTLGVTATLICVGVLLEVYQFICERDEAAKQMQFFEIEQNVQEGNNFWVLEEKEREKKQNSVGSDIDLNEKIKDKESPSRDQNLIFDFSGE